MRKALHGIILVPASKKRKPITLPRKKRSLERRFEFCGRSCGFDKLFREKKTPGGKLPGVLHLFFFLSRLFEVEIFDVQHRIVADENALSGQLFDLGQDGIVTGFERLAHLRVHP